MWALKLIEDFVEERPLTVVTLSLLWLIAVVVVLALGVWEIVTYSWLGSPRLI